MHAIGDTMMSHMAVGRVLCSTRSITTSVVRAFEERVSWSGFTGGVSEQAACGSSVTFTDVMQVRARVTQVHVAVFVQ